MISDVILCHLYLPTFPYSSFATFHLVDLVDLHFYFLGVLQPVSLGILHQHNGILHLSNYWLIKHDYLFFFDKIDNYEVNKKNKTSDD